MSQPVKTVPTHVDIPHGDTLRLSFDDWFKLKHNGLSFEDLHEHPGVKYDDTLRALTRAVRDYVTEMAR